MDPIVDNQVKEKQTKMFFLTDSDSVLLFVKLVRPTTDAFLVPGRGVIRLEPPHLRQLRDQLDELIEQYPCKDDETDYLG